MPTGKGLSLAGSYRITHYKQGMLSDSWQSVFISGKLQGYTLQTRNTEIQLANGCHWQEVTWLHATNTEYWVTAGKGLLIAGSDRVTHYKQGILSDSWQRVVISGKLQDYTTNNEYWVTTGKGLSLVGSYRITHYKQRILSANWQRVVISGKLQDYTLQTRNAEWQLAKRFH